MTLCSISLNHLAFLTVAQLSLLHLCAGGVRRSFVVVAGQSYCSGAVAGEVIFPATNGQQKVAGAVAGRAVFPAGIGDQAGAGSDAGEVV